MRCVIYVRMREWDVHLCCSVLQCVATEIRHTHSHRLNTHTYTHTRTRTQIIRMKKRLCPFVREVCCRVLQCVAVCCSGFPRKFNRLTQRSNIYVKLCTLGDLHLQNLYKHKHIRTRANTHTHTLVKYMCAAWYSGWSASAQSVLPHI